MRVKMSKQPTPAPTTSAVGPCPTVIQIVGRPGTGSLPRTIAPPDHPQAVSTHTGQMFNVHMSVCKFQRNNDEVRKLV